MRYRSETAAASRADGSVMRQCGIEHMGGPAKSSRPVGLQVVPLHVAGAKGRRLYYTMPFMVGANLRGLITSLLEASPGIPSGRAPNPPRSPPRAAAANAALHRGPILCPCL